MTRCVLMYIVHIVFRVLFCLCLVAFYHCEHLLEVAFNHLQFFNLI